MTERMKKTKWVSSVGEVVWTPPPSRCRNMEYHGTHVLFHFFANARWRAQRTIRVQTLLQPLKSPQRQFFGTLLFFLFSLINWIALAALCVDFLSYDHPEPTWKIIFLFQNVTLWNSVKWHINVGQLCIWYANAVHWGLGEKIVMQYVC